MTDGKNESVVPSKPLTVDITPVKEESVEVATKIMRENNPDKVKDLTHLFNVLQAKKNVARVMKLDGLLDHVSDAMLDRFEKRPDEFSNQDLIAYMNTVQTAIEKATKSVNMVDETPAIVVNNNTQVNVDNGTCGGLDRESRERVADFIKKVLENAQKKDYEDTAVETTAEDITDGGTNNDVQ